MFSFQYRVNGKNCSWNFIFFFFILSLRNPMCVLHFQSDAKFSPEILHLDLDVRKCTVEKVDSHTQVVLYVLKDLSVTELGIGF